MNLSCFIVASQEHSGLQAGDELAKTTINEESATPADRNSKFCFEFAGVRTTNLVVSKLRTKFSVVWPACKVNILAIENHT